MRNEVNDKLITLAINTLKDKTLAIGNKINDLNILNEKLLKGLSTWYKASEDIEVVKLNIVRTKEDVKELQSMLGSPYFYKISCNFEDENKNQDIYISKYSFPEQKIYSWVSPVARLRFSDPGNASYIVPSGKARGTTIYEKDKYKIREGEIYQFEHITPKGKEILINTPLHEHRSFGLSEIIEELDAYQDDIIRISPYGSMLISGAAGSGKTTLALHRIAFLAQNPETSREFLPSKTLIFVQDEQTKSYFSSLLPNLGLQTAKITTFADWACEQLGIDASRYSHDTNSIESSLLYLAKSKAIKNYAGSILDSQDIYERLESVYFEFLDETSYQHYKQQKEDRVLDRFDLSVLLFAKLKNKKVNSRHNLILIDEAENYLGLQLDLIKLHLSETTRSIMYIGDLVQQTYIGTIRNWEEIGERFATGKKISIPKVYRITAQIQKYLISKGYAAETNNQLKEGPEVEEYEIQSTSHIAEQISTTLSSDHYDTIGIISNEAGIIADLKLELAHTNSHFLTIHQAQGVEFDVCFMIFKKQELEAQKIDALDLQEIRKVERDLFYVGATRARRKLVVFEG